MKLACKDEAECDNKNERGFFIFNLFFGSHGVRVGLAIVLVGGHRDTAYAVWDRAPFSEILH